MIDKAKSVKKKILVVDDEPSVLYAIERVLRDEYNILKASNGEEAVNLAQSCKPDIILMDTIMPKKDGITACTEIKAIKATQSIPVIMLTVVGHELNKALAKNMGANGYITKPFKPQELLDTINKVLNGSD